MKIFISLVLAITITYLFCKSQKLNKLRTFVYKIFWVEEIKNSKSNDKFAYNFLNSAVKFFMYPYVFFISYILTLAIINLSVSSIFSSIIIIIIWPLIYRIVMGLQRKLHGI